MSKNRIRLQKRAQFKAQKNYLIMELRSTTIEKTRYQPKLVTKSIKKYNDDNYDYYWQCNEGLPNMGNTCFLNSAIQFLYSSQLFRSAIMEIKSPKFSLQNNLAKIFFCIQNERNLYEKLQILAKIIQFLRNKHNDYQIYSQQDCFQFILLILSIIGQKYPDILQFFKLYYKYVCSYCKNAIKRKQYIICSQHIYCDVCKIKMNLKYISIPKCIITSSSISQKQIKIMTVEDVEISYKLVARVIYIGNGRFGHYKVSRRKSLGKFGDTFFTFSDSFIHEQRNYFHGNQYQKILLSLYEIQSQHDRIEIEPQINKPIETTRINVHLSKVYTDHQAQKNMYKPQSLKGNSVVKSNIQDAKSPIKLQKNLDFKQIFGSLGIKPLWEIISVYKKIKSISKIITQIKYGQNSIVQSIKSIFFNFSSTQFYYHQNQRFMHEATNIKQRLQAFQYVRNEKLLQQICEKLPLVIQNGKLQSNSDKLILKTVLFIAITEILTHQHPQFKQKFNFTFKYDCQKCNKRISRGEGFFITNQTYFCCKKTIDFKHFYFIKKPTYLIFINETDKNQQSYEFNCANVGYPVQFKLKSSISLSPTINFEIVQQNIFKVQISFPNTLIRKQLICKNITLKQVFRTMNLDMHRYLRETKNKVKINQNQQELPGSKLQQLQLNQIKLRQKYYYTLMSINYEKFNINVELIN